jgi:elongator complex protein 3
LGTQLVEKAKEMALAAGYGRIAVISAIGTRNYYRKLGFERDGLYMTAALDER